MNCTDDINHRVQLVSKTNIITPQPDMVLSNVDQIDKHLGDSRELGSVKTKQYMTETTTESNGTAKTNRDCT